MKVNASVKKMCRKCKIIKRKGVVRVICADPRHKPKSVSLPSMASAVLALVKF